MYRSGGVYPPDYREFARCEHRRISLFCAIQCWINGWDGIRVSRDQFKKLLALKRLKSSRVEWMKEDFQELFPFQRPDDPSPWLELSRRAFEGQTVIGECIIPERLNSDNIDTLGKNFVPTRSYANNNTECTLMNYLWLLDFSSLAVTLH